MKTLRKIAVAVSVVAVTTTAHASVNAHNYTPTANPAYIYSEDTLMSTNWGAYGQRPLYFSAYYDMVNDPLVELNDTHTQRRLTLIDSMNSMNFAFGYKFSQRAQIGATTGVSLVRLPDNESQFGMGDSKAFIKVRLNNERDTFQVGLMPELTIPSGDKSLFLSDGGFGGGLRLIVEHDFGPVQASGNIGYRYNRDAVYKDLKTKSIIPMSLSALVPIGPRWAINVDGKADMLFPINKHVNPSSVYAGFRYRLPSDLVVTAGGAVGSLNTYSSADFQAIVGVSFSPETRVAPIEHKPAPVIRPVAIAAPAPVVVSGIQKAKPRVEFTTKEVIVREEVKFKHAKAVLTPSGKKLLDEVAEVLRKNKGNYKLIVVEGHTNELGGYKYNQKLSEKRAAAVKEYLMSRGISAKTLSTIGYGKTKPKHGLDGLSKEARLAANRRVEFKVVQ